MPFKQLPTQPKQIFLPIMVVFLSIAAFIFNDQFANAFIYQRDLVADGQWWRLLTSNVFHTNLMHLVLNCAALILLWLLHGDYYNHKTYALLIIVGSITCNIGIYFFTPEMYSYVGLSGLLHGVFMWGALQDIYHKDKTGYLLFIGGLLKISHEQIFGANDSVKQLIEANVAVDAHLWGAIAGVIVFIFFTQKTNKSNLNK